MDVFPAELAHGRVPRLVSARWQFFSLMEASMSNNQSDSDPEQVPAVLSRREVLKAGAAAAIMPLFGGANSIAQAIDAAHASAAKVLDTATQWLSYGGDKASLKYSPLAQ